MLPMKKLYDLYICANPYIVVFVNVYVIRLRSDELDEKYLL